MIPIRESYNYSEEELLIIVDFINAILSNAEITSNDEYIITFDDMTSMNEVIRKIRRNVNEHKNAASKRSIRTTKAR